MISILFPNTHTTKGLLTTILKRPPEELVDMDQSLVVRLVESFAKIYGKVLPISATSRISFILQRSGGLANSQREDGVWSAPLGERSPVWYLTNWYRKP